MGPLDFPPPRPGVLGVLYAEDFDEDGITAAAGSEAAPEPEVIESVFTAAELDAARLEGRDIGRREAEGSLAAARNQMVGLLAASIADARDEQRVMAQEAADAAARCILSALSACLPALCDRHGAAELQAMVRAVLPALVDEPRITVRINPQMLAPIQAEIAALDIEIAERVRLLPSDSIAPGDVRITWAEGSAIRDTARARTAVEDALAALGLYERETLQQEMADA
jgi:flagellar assembly protein FliH